MRNKGGPDWADGVFFRGLFNVTSDLILTHDNEGRLLSVNPAFCRLMRVRPEAALKRNIRDYISPKQHVLFDRKFQKEISAAGVSRFRPTIGMVR